MVPQPLELAPPPVAVTLLDGVTEIELVFAAAAAAAAAVTPKKESMGEPLAPDSLIFGNII